MAGWEGRALGWASRALDRPRLPARVGRGTIKRGGSSFDMASSLSGGSRMGTMGSWMMGNLRADAGGGMWNVAAKAGMSAIKGSVVGGVVGGTASALQGGSFWEGAKSGAWDGGMISAGYSTLHRASGAMGSRLNPLGKKKGSEGMLRAGRNMWDATNSNSAISEPARQLLNQKQRAGITNRVMNAHR